MLSRFATAFEVGLQKLADGLQMPRGIKSHAKVMERIGRLKQKSWGAAQHYAIEVKKDESGLLVTALTWRKILVEGRVATHPGVYCLRSNELEWDAERMWRTYGHLFITVLAYQCVQVSVVVK
jgi:hypothetical protein